MLKLKSAAFYWTQVSLESSLWVPMSTRTRPCWIFAAMIQADDDTNSILADDANRAIHMWWSFRWWWSSWQGDVVGCFTKFYFMEHIKLGLCENCFYKIISNLLIPTHWISFFLFKMTSWSHIWREKELGKFMTKYSLTLVKFPHIDNLEIGNAFIAIVSFNPLLAQQKQTCKKIMQPVKLEIQTESNHLCNWQQFCSQNSRTSIALFYFHIFALTCIVYLDWF